MFDEPSHDPDGYTDGVLDEILRNMILLPPEEGRAQTKPRKPRLPTDHPQYKEEIVRRGSRPGDIELRTRRVTNKEVDKRIREGYGRRVKRVGPYGTRQLPVRCFCNKCKEEFLQRAESLFRGCRTRCGCPEEKVSRKRK